MQIQGINDLGEIDADLFAGGGGWSTGFERATGISPAIAVNHDPAAIAMHEANHPDSRHYCESVFDVEPRKACGGYPVRWLHGSPDCTHFSRAKGGKPLSQGIRGLAWVLVTWAAATAPRILSLENVPEFVKWGPLLADGTPDKARIGETFREFVDQLKALGYAVEWRVLCAADYGAPTIRRRLFLIARRDGLPIRWPEPTHGEGRPLPWRTAAECIDWSLPCPSIFDPAERRRHGMKPVLVDATMRRIAAGVVRYVIEAADPFVIRTDMQSDGRLRGVGSLREPLRTMTSSGGHAVCVPTMIQTGYGERAGQAPRVPGLDKPFGTAVAGGSKHALVAAFIAKHNGGTTGQAATEPMHTIVGGPNKALVAAHLTKFYGTSIGADLRDPAPTVTGQGGHAGLVAALLVKYYGAAGQAQDVRDPMHTIVSRARFGLVTCTIAGEEWAIVDIGMRMIRAREYARAQGFEDDYVLTGGETSQVERIGNSVCPDVAEAIVRANLPAAVKVTRRRKTVAA
jgi:DNA (cytosine-5)-methyltransferase 1